MIPFTVVTLFPINDELNMTAGKGLLEGKDADSKEAKRIDQLLKNWSFRHYIREGMFGVVWALGVWATLLAKPL